MKKIEIKTWIGICLNTCLNFCYKSRHHDKSGTFYKLPDQSTQEKNIIIKNK